MVDLFLILLCFSGFAYASIHWLRINPSHAPLFTISFIGVVLFLFALFDHLQTGAFCLIVSGVVFSFFWIRVYLKNKQEKTLAPFFRPLAVFLILVSIAFIMTRDMAFTVIDDYVYWGIMGKYLYLNNHLPNAGCPLDPRILAYTPGTSLIHYFFFKLTGQYAVSISYFAQSMILTSALFVVFDREHIKRSIVYIAILVILMTVFFGSIVTKLQVDYLLSIICFSIFWIYYTQTDIDLTLLTLSMPICFLFLIKEVGFMLGLLIVAVIVLDVLRNSSMGFKEKIKPLLFILFTGVALLILKTVWINHASAMGFSEFHNAINLESIKTTLNIVSDEKIQKGFLIFIRELIIGPADRLNIPYVFWYMAIAMLWHRNSKMFHRNDKSRFFLFSGIVLTSFLLYLFLLYCMQIIIFQVGSAYDHTMGFSRYLNIIFSPILFMVAITFCHTTVFDQKTIGRTILFPLIAVVLIVLGASRVEVGLNRESRDIQIQSFSDGVASRINRDMNAIGLVTGKNDNIANLQFQYHLLPHKVDLSINNKFLNQSELMQYMVTYDYVLLYHPDPLILDWLEPYMGNETRVGQIELVRVRQAESDGQGLKAISLERVLP